MPHSRRGWVVESCCFFFISYAFVFFTFGCYLGALTILLSLSYLSPFFPHTISLYHAVSLRILNPTCRCVYTIRCTLWQSQIVYVFIRTMHNRIYRMLSDSEFMIIALHYTRGRNSLAIMYEWRILLSLCIRRMNGACVCTHVHSKCLLQKCHRLPSILGNGWLVIDRITGNHCTWKYWHWYGCCCCCCNQSSIPVL